MAKCPDKSKLESFARDELDAEESRVIEQHAESCKRCAQKLAALPIDDDLLTEISKLEASRRENAPAVEVMRSRHEGLSTSLFGDANGGSRK